MLVDVWAGGADMRLSSMSAIPRRDSWSQTDRAIENNSLRQLADIIRPMSAPRRASESRYARARGSGQFRLDANLPGGTRSYCVSHGPGALKEVDGKISEIPLHNTISVGILTFPYPSIAAGLSGPLTVGATFTSGTMTLTHNISLTLTAQ